MKQIKIGTTERRIVSEWLVTQPEENVRRLKDALGVVNYDYYMEQQDSGCKQVRICTSYGDNIYPPIPAEDIIFHAYMYIRNNMF